MRDFLNSRKAPAIMGIVNASGESFSERELSAAGSALDRALRLLDDGADMLDLGGESTRPGAIAVAPDEEISRVIPVLKKLKSLRPGTICSIDTRNVKTAQAALDAGAEIINDVSMLRNAPETASVIAEYQAGLILMHSRGTPDNMMEAANCIYPHGVAVTAAEEIAEAEKFAVASGIKAENILLDPGFGFAKNAEQCWELARDLEKFAPPARTLIGVSRKSFLGKLIDEADPLARGSATLALELDFAARGTAVIRTHAVRDLKRGLLVWQQLHGA